MNAQEYVRKWFAPEDSLYEMIAEELKQRKIRPQSVSPEVAHTLKMLVKISGAKEILEIGALGGYSTINFAKALEGTGSITSLEISPEMAAFATQNATNEGVATQITFRIGHAIDSLVALKKEGRRFDFVFIDADKENYPNYLDLVLDLANPHALIIADNAFWSGRIFDPENQEESTQGIRLFNEKVATDERFDAMLLAIGDGLLVARVK